MTRTLCEPATICTAAYGARRATHYATGDGKGKCTEILEVNFFVFAYRLFHEDISPFDGALLLKNLPAFYTLNIKTTHPENPPN